MNQFEKTNILYFIFYIQFKAGNISESSGSQEASLAFISGKESHESGFNVVSETVKVEPNVSEASNTEGTSVQMSKNTQDDEVASENVNK